MRLYKRRYRQRIRENPVRLQQYRENQRVHNKNYYSRKKLQLNLSTKKWRVLHKVICINTECSGHGQCVSQEWQFQVLCVRTCCGEICPTKVLITISFQLPTRSAWQWAVLGWEAHSALGLLPKEPALGKKGMKLALGKKGIGYTSVSLDNEWEKTLYFFSNTGKENACIAEDTMKKNGSCMH